MTQTLLFDQVGIKVCEEIDEQLPIQVSYWISEGDIGFSTWEQPELNIESLRKMIEEYLFEKYLKITNDI